MTAEIFQSDTKCWSNKLPNTVFDKHVSFLESNWKRIKQVEVCRRWAGVSMCTHICPSPKEEEDVQNAEFPQTYIFSILFCRFTHDCRIIATHWAKSHTFTHAPCVRRRSKRRVSSLYQHKAKRKGRKLFHLGNKTAGDVLTERDSDSLCSLFVRERCLSILTPVLRVLLCEAVFLQCLTNISVSVCLCCVMRLWVILVRFLVHEPVWISESPCSSQLMANHYGSWQMPSSWLPRQPHRLHPSWLGWCLRNGLLSKPSLSLMVSLIGAMHKWIRIGQNCDLGRIHNRFRTRISFLFFFF